MNLTPHIVGKFVLWVYIMVACGALIARQAITALAMKVGWESQIELFQQSLSTGRGFVMLIFVPLLLLTMIELRSWDMALAAGSHGA